jgi:hypothetical protein
MLDVNPWDIEPDLTRERLVWTARQFVAVRRQAVQDFSSVKGDIAWNHGCTCYARQSTAIVRASLSGEYPWLRVLDSSLKFIFAIGRVPCRFYKGDADRPSMNLREAFPELRQRQGTLAVGQTSFVPANDVTQLAWLFAIETDDSGLVTRVSVAAFSATEELVVSYEIPLDNADMAGGGGAPPIAPLPPPPPVPIAPPMVSAPAEKKKISDDSEGND